ncbi:hypothetical protein MsAg5_11850 [Methanosarcinaceae archaeon Ag5]|uniref:Methyltransferase domain-containing protein n=1 Tax=Methanolapillus africanus TaxID=3028297 RepID=A0AAE4MKJ7_9EURY|nr:hypothetical protein [Methanosarcinaceae archaeon Ag5]
MLIEDIVGYCHESYVSGCSGCNNNLKCPSCVANEFECENDVGCQECFDNIFSLNPLSYKRKYDCIHMANYYVCKYSFKYANEMVFALRNINLDQIKAVSIGCGPCTDLFAIDYMAHEDHRFENFDFVGIDSCDIWDDVQGEIREHYPQVAFSPNINNLARDWNPNLVIFNYVFSHIVAFEDDIEAFIRDMDEFINNLPMNSYVIINDINYASVRMCFERLINGNFSVSKYHFEGYGRYYPYGDENPNEFPIQIPLNLKRIYDPHAKCTSAQMILRKVR